MQAKVCRFNKKLQLQKEKAWRDCPATFSPCPAEVLDQRGRAALQPGYPQTRLQQKITRAMFYSFFSTHYGSYCFPTVIDSDPSRNRYVSTQPLPRRTSPALPVRSAPNDPHGYAIPAGVVFLLPARICREGRTFQSARRSRKSCHPR